MSWKEKLHPAVSKAEIEVFKELSRQNLTRSMVTQKTIVLKLTVPDFLWLNQRKIVFLDGEQVHSSDRQQERDEEIDGLLEAQGWDVKRIRYHAPLTRMRLEEIVSEIKELLGE